MASKSKPIAEQQVYDTNTPSTGAFDIPTGTTAQRPSSPTSGMIRYNTDTQATEIYDGTQWGKVSPVLPTLSSVTGTPYTTISSNLTLAGTGFLAANLVVGFTPSGGSQTTVTVTPTSDTAATVAVPSAIYNQSGGTSISVTVTNSDNRTSTALSFNVLSLPSGGDHVFNQGSARVHIFKSNANFVVPSGVSLSNVEYLIVAGGGGGANNGGGGGAGGLRSSVVGDTSGRGASAETRMSLSAATYPVVVGTGGSGTNGASGGQQTNGVASSFNSISSTGGGAGGEIYGSGGAAGGSGGGGAGYSGTSGGAGTSGQGYDGGVGYTINSGGYAGGGGGGAGVVGGNASASASGIGGDGQISTIITTSEATTYSVGDVVSSDVYFAGGGHGRGAGTNPSTTARGSYGGGGQAVTAQEGVDYTGGGGGAHNSNANNGGDGVVIIRYTL